MSAPIYHITHIDNLERIIVCNGLWCDAERLRQGFQCVGIAHESLKVRRSRTPVRKRTGVPVAAGGVLADYVPFYFTNRSPMLFSIHRGYVVGYDGGQGSVLHLVSSVRRVIEGGCQWCFTDGHAVEAMTEFYADQRDANKVDWSIVQSWSWKNTDGDPDRKRRKQAEFLVHQSFPWTWIERIGVIDGATKSHVERVMAVTGVEHRPAVEVQRRWYY